MDPKSVVNKSCLTCIHCYFGIETGGAFCEKKYKDLTYGWCYNCLKYEYLRHGKKL